MPSNELFEDSENMQNGREMNLESGSKSVTIEVFDLRNWEKEEKIVDKNVEGKNINLKYGRRKYAEPGTTSWAEHYVADEVYDSPRKEVIVTNPNRKHCISESLAKLLESYRHFDVKTNFDGSKCWKPEKGTPDILIYDSHDNKLEFAEVKLNGDELRENQIDWLIKTGFDVYLVRVSC